MLAKETLPLYYVIRELDTVPDVSPPMMRGKSHSEEHGYLEREIIMRAYHIHPNLR